MSLQTSYTPNYYSIDDILTTQERIPCKFLQDVPNLGKLDSSSVSDDLKLGSELELPFWLVEVISDKQPIVSASLPKIYKEFYREILTADSCAVDLHKLNLNFYELGGYVKKFDTRKDEVQNCLEQTFKQRFRLIMDLCEQTFMDPGSLDRLDLLERRLYQDGHAAKMKLNQWLNESDSKIEASDMVQNHRKRKRINLEASNAAARINNG